MTRNGKSRMRRFTFTLTAVIALSTPVALGGECIIFSEELPDGADFALRVDSQFEVSDSDPYQGEKHLKRDFATWGSWAWITGIMNLNLDLTGIDFDTAYLEFYIDGGTSPVSYLELRLAGPGWDPDFQTTSVTVDDQPGYELVQVMLKDFAGIGASSGVSPTNLDEFTGGTGMIDRISWGFEAAGDLLIDEVRILDAEGGVTSLATWPVPADGQGDVSRDPTLGWRPGQSADTHDVYLGTVFEDVNAASRADPRDVLLSQGQPATTFDPGRLEIGSTYYWRVDEVNAAPDNTIFRGQVWSFTVEPLAYPIENVTATSNAASSDTEGPDNTINGSGLDENDHHSTSASDMWLASPVGDDPVQIQYEFDKIYKLHEMLVWNYNVEFELVLGFGFSGVTVEHSVDGVEWTALGDLEFAQAAAANDYAANTAVDFGGAAVKFVKLTASSNHGAIPQYGLSEIRFLFIPIQARLPQPASGTTDVSVDTVLSWRAGREAAVHEILLSTDEAAVADGTAPVHTVETSSYAPADLMFGSVYYWKVNEVNEAEAIPMWEGETWNFTTQEFAWIDGFEDYDDEDNAIFDTWIDGFVNETGSIVGYFNAPFAERSIVNSGSQSMPLEYNNTAAPFYSEAEFDLGAMDLTAGGAVSLRLFFHGNAANGAETLYLAIEDSAGNVAVAAHPDPDAALADSWQEWLIPYSELTAGGVDLSRAAMIYIGLGDRNNPTAGGTGTVFIDDVGFGTPLAGI